MKGKFVGELEDNTIWSVILKSIILPGLLVSPSRPSDKSSFKNECWDLVTLHIALEIFLIFMENGGVCTFKR